ncbi:GNAT family N-acetyltransferase [Ornithinimicrobium sp. INDO-MA30-4]|uniref:GNAT family N-acetyltransferase n=1 Tax=Ornithinimicrobium sp. INDO-MA30-4 TaxID=2908651 RepID=UPI001F3A1BFD|nr:GNAT family N-acetyltransferase [Ornithinimicrobium sp. INDO-MA30-4]UJH70726.1 GNAT family N-acetyltransferase [Ornithinimicrobium sp. INDO-MA30-4]
MVQETVYTEAFTGILPDETVAQFDAGEFGSIWRTSIKNPPTPAHRVLVACAGDQVVGFAAIGPATDDDAAAPDKAGEILALAVHPDARRQGHGSRLLNAIADTLRAHEHETVLAWVLADDEVTRGFLRLGGLDPDEAWRERAVDASGATVREVRVWASLPG